MSYSLPQVSGNALCPCEGKSLDRFVHPVALAVLACHPDGLHGYVLARRMAPIIGASPDSTGLYRLLRLMEASGYLASSLTKQSSGPARRIYRITERGKDCLSIWQRTLRDYAGQVERIAGFCEAQA